MYWEWQSNASHVLGCLIDFRRRELAAPRPFGE